MSPKWLKQGSLVQKTYTLYTFSFAAKGSPFKNIVDYFFDDGLPLRELNKFCVLTKAESRAKLGSVKLIEAPQCL